LGKLFNLIEELIMKPKTQHIAGLIAVVGCLAALPASADHNSVWGAGWANMPNDIHNTRIEDNLSGQEWRDFVRQGNGASTTNRYLDGTTNRYLDGSSLPSQRSMSGSRGGSVASGGGFGGGRGGGGRR
jgi:hypothetical protein